MGKLGQMGGLMWGVREEWVTGRWPKEIQEGRVSARDEENVPVGSNLPGCRERTPQVSRSDRPEPDVSARVKVALNLSKSYGFNHNFDEGLGTVHNLCPWLSPLQVHLAAARTPVAQISTSHFHQERLLSVNQSRMLVITHIRAILTPSTASFSVQCPRFLTTKMADWKTCTWRTDPRLQLVWNRTWVSNVARTGALSRWWHRSLRGSWR